MKKMLTFDPGQRPSAKECYEHAWFKKEHRLDKRKLDHDTLKNFKRFHYRSKLQRALYHFLADNLSSAEEKKRLTETFKALDTNGDGTLSRQEIENGYKKTVGITKKEVDHLLEQVDVNHSGKINYTGIFEFFIFLEFMVASLDRRNLLTDNKIEACFKLFDKVGI